MVFGKTAISPNMPLVTTTIGARITVFSKAAKAVFAATSRTDATLAIRAWCFVTLFTTIFATRRTSSVMVGIRAIGVNQEQAVDQRTAAGHTQNGDNKQAGGKMSHSFIIPSVFNNLALYEATHHVPHQIAKTIQCS
jgi:hypothetical protein